MLAGRGKIVERKALRMSTNRIVARLVGGRAVHHVVPVARHDLLGARTDVVVTIITVGAPVHGGMKGVGMECTGSLINT